jgi:hypothetical protein
LTTCALLIKLCFGECLDSPHPSRKPRKRALSSSQAAFFILFCRMALRIHPVIASRRRGNPA